MRKKVLSAVLAATMVAGMMGNVVSVSAEEKYDLTLYSVNTTDPDFDDWLANVEEATGLNQCYCSSDRYRHTSAEDYNDSFYRRFFRRHCRNQR